MIPTVDRLNQSIGIGNVPPIGTTGSMFNPDRLEEMRKRLMNPSADIDVEEHVNAFSSLPNFTEPDEDILGVDEEIELDTSINLNTLSQDMNKVIDPTAPAAHLDIPLFQEDTESKEDSGSSAEDIKDTDEEDTSIKEGEEEDEDFEDLLPQKTGSPLKNKKVLIVIAALAVIVVIVIIIISSGAKTSETPPQPQTPAATTSKEHRYANDQIEPTDVIIYQDSMVIDKYFILDQDACTFVFEGYAENARAFIKAYVDLETYNKYKVGARVPVTYQRVTLSGKDYYMKVRII